MIQYPAHIKYSRSDACYHVEFPDLPGCLTYGATVDEAKKNAREALTGYLESIDMRSLPIPAPSSLKGKEVYAIVPERRVAFAVWLKLKRLERGMTQKDVARLLEINMQSYQRIENPKVTNPTLRTIAKLEQAFGETILSM